LAELVRCGRGKLAVVLGGFGGEEFGHGAFGEITAVEDLPLVVEFGQDCGGEPAESRWVGEDLDDVGSSFDLPVQPLDRYLEFSSIAVP
jgi:hypothetical protein